MQRRQSNKAPFKCDCSILSIYALRTVTGQNGIGQNGTDKMVQTKWYGQNGSNFYRFQFN